MTILEFIVYGDAATQGSKRAIINPKTGKPIVIEQTDKTLRPWRQNVAAAAAEARDSAEAPTIEGPVIVFITFHLERPASYPKRMRLPWKGKDVDKLARAVLDALKSAGVYRDDSRVTDLIVRKRFGADELGARVRVETIDESTFELVQVEPGPAEMQGSLL